MRRNKVHNRPHNANLCSGEPLRCAICSGHNPSLLVLAYLYHMNHMFSPTVICSTIVLQKTFQFAWINSTTFSFPWRCIETYTDALIGYKEDSGRKFLWRKFVFHYFFIQIKPYIRFKYLLDKCCHFDKKNIRMRSLENFTKKSFYL